MEWLIDKIREWFCEHEWECLVEKQPVYDIDLLGNMSSFPICYKWIYVCKKCKKVKKVNT